ncbi:MAG: hypothetical protein L0Z62_06855 [Gemmataceae bacterium]|nr:hypothetical protein [Gemmataceae bacterium]
MVLTARLTVLLALLGLSEPAEDALDARRQAAADEQLLKSAHLPTDGPGLVTFLRKQVLTEADTKRIQALIGQLGDGTFKVRDRALAGLVACGPAALPLLRAASKPLDLEGQRRVANCIRAIERVPWTEVVMAAARRLQDLRPAGASAALLGALPVARDEVAEETIIEALAALGAGDGKEVGAFAAALRDPEPLRRAAAALVLGAFGDAEQRAAVRAVMRSDLYLSVRLRAARGLLTAGDKEAVPVLLAIVAEGSSELAHQADGLLRRVAGDKSPAAEPENDPDARRKCRDGWQAWWEANHGRVELASSAGFLINAIPQARGVALQFMNALLNADLSTLRRVTDSPFTFAGLEHAPTRQALDKILAKCCKDGPMAGQFSVRFVRTRSLDECARNDKERALLKAAFGTGVRVVLTEWRDEREASVVPVFVRVRGGRVRVIGVGGGPQICPER